MMQLIKRVMVLFLPAESVTLQADYSNRALQLSDLSLNIGTASRELIVSVEEDLSSLRITTFFE